MVDEVGGDGRDIVAGVRLTSDIKCTIFELWVLCQEAFEETVEVCGDLYFVAHLVALLGLGESCTDRLIDIQKIGRVVPRVLV